MLSLLRSGRWQAFTAAAVVAIIAFGLLSVWQWHRAEEKRAEFALVESAMTNPALPVAELSDPADWQAVTATGTYDESQQFLVRNQPQNGSNGLWVVTLLRSDPRDVWVVRGWIAVDLSQGPAQAPPEPPTGQVTVEGFARTSEPGPLRAGSDLPVGQITKVAVAELDEAAGVESQPFFMVATRDPSLTPVTRPEPTDTRNLSYAGQWLLFAGIAIGGWYFFLRREAQEVAADQRRSDVPVGSGR